MTEALLQRPSTLQEAAALALADYRLLDVNGASCGMAAAAAGQTELFMWLFSRASSAVVTTRAAGTSTMPNPKPLGTSTFPKRAPSLSEHLP